MGSHVVISFVSLRTVSLAVRILILPCGSPCCGAFDEDRRLLWHVHREHRGCGLSNRRHIGADKREDIGSIEPSAFAEYDTLIVGAPTWHTGEEKERSGTDWDSVIYLDLPSMDLSGKKVAFFGCGDSQSYGDYFCDAVGELHDQFSATGATL